MIQTILVICAAIIEDEYILFALPLIEFLVVVMGTGTKYLKICAFQVLVHIWGCVLITFSLVEKIDSSYLMPLCIIFTAIPLALELLVILLHCCLMRIQRHYIQRPGQRSKLSAKEVKRRKKKEQKGISKTRARNINEKMEEIREKRRLDGRDVEEPQENAAEEDKKIDDGFPQRQGGYPQRQDGGYYPQEDYKKQGAGYPEDDHYYGDEQYPPREDDYPPRDGDYPPRYDDYPSKSDEEDDDYPKRRGGNQGHGPERKSYDKSGVSLQERSGYPDDSPSKSGYYDDSPSKSGYYDDSPSRNEGYHKRRGDPMSKSNEDQYRESLNKRRNDDFSKSHGDPFSKSHGVDLDEDSPSYRY